MKLNRRSRIAIAALGLTLLTAPFSQGQLLLKPAGALRVDGDSTLHKWSVMTSGVAMTLAFANGAPQALSAALKAAQVKGMEVRVPVASLRSGESALDKNMRNAMSADKFPDVVYKLGWYELSKTADAGVIAAKTTGELTIAGQTKTVSMDVEFHLGADKAAVVGSYTLKMSEFGIKPPTLMLGAIKVRDPVTIRFDLTLDGNKDGALTTAANDTPHK